LRRETLVGDVVHGFFGQQVADHGALAVVALLRRDSHHLAHGRVRAVGRNEQRAIEPFTPALIVFDSRRRFFRTKIDAHNAGRAQHVDAVELIERRLQDGPEYAIDDHVTQRFDALFFGVDVRKAEAPLVGNVNRTYRRRSSHDVRPKAHGLEHALRAAGQSGRTIVKTRLCGFLARDGLHDSHAQAQRRQCQRQARANHAATGDDDVVLPLAHALRINASISSGSRASPLLRTSGPLLVTATSSSIRIPMLRNAFGILRRFGR